MHRTNISQPLRDNINMSHLSNKKQEARQLKKLPSLPAPLGSWGLADLDVVALVL
jgi:hypothetical protein